MKRLKDLINSIVGFFSWMGTRLMAAWNSFWMTPQEREQKEKEWSEYTGTLEKTIPESNQQQLASIIILKEQETKEKILVNLIILDKIPDNVLSVALSFLTPGELRAMLTVSKSFAKSVNNERNKRFKKLINTILSREFKGELRTQLTPLLTNEKLCWRYIPAYYKLRIEAAKKLQENQQYDLKLVNLIRPEMLFALQYVNSSMFFIADVEKWDSITKNPNLDLPNMVACFSDNSSDKRSVLFRYKIGHSNKLDAELNPKVKRYFNRNNTDASSIEEIKNIYEEVYINGETITCIQFFSNGSEIIYRKRELKDHNDGMCLKSTTLGKYLHNTGKTILDLYNDSPDWEILKNNPMYLEIDKFRPRGPRCRSFHGSYSRRP